MLVVFDAYGTLFDVHSAVMRHREAVGPRAAQLSDLWRGKQLEYTWVQTLLGRYIDFWSLTEAALEQAAGACGGVSDETRAALLAAYRTLDAYADVRPALSRLRRDGHTAAILSNATAAMLDQATASAGLAECFEAVLSVEAVRVYKPDPGVYRMVGDRFGIEPDMVTFVSSNRWDVAGAAAFGFTTVWLNRSARPDEYAALAPSQIITSLNDLDRTLL